MAKHKWMCSIINQDGFENTIFFETWAEQNLNADEYEEYSKDLEDWKTVQKKLAEVGFTEQRLITEEIDLGNGEFEEIHVGWESTFPTNGIEALNLNGLYDPDNLWPYAMNKWFDKMANDPRIIVYNPLTRIE